jgi:hypothetical protein
MPKYKITWGGSLEFDAKDEEHAWFLYDDWMMNYNDEPSIVEVKEKCTSAQTVKRKSTK